MKTNHISAMLWLVVLASCDSNMPPNQVGNQNQDSSNARVSTQDYDPDNDCVFDTSSYKFTTEAIKKYDPKLKYVWDNKIKVAKAILTDGDTILLSIGGCTHFGYSATLYTSIPFDDTEALIGKARWLAATFFDDGFDTKYDQCIAQKEFKKRDSYDNINVHSFEIIDKDTSLTNMIYEGFSFFRQKNSTKILISGYIN